MPLQNWRGLVLDAGSSDSHHRQRLRTSTGCGHSSAADCSICFWESFTSNLKSPRSESRTRCSEVALLQAAGFTLVNAQRWLAVDPDAAGLGFQLKPEPTYKELLTQPRLARQLKYLHVVRYMSRAIDQTRLWARFSGERSEANQRRNILLMSSPETRTGTTTSYRYICYSFIFNRLHTHRDVVVVALASEAGAL